MAAYYNENDPFCAQWLRNLIGANLIAPGDVDERSIEDVRPNDVSFYDQAHFFAGIGIWSHALRLSGWDDLRPVWTGSCPCQPFSAAGKGAGFADERHLWPAWFHLICERRPPVVFGEQVGGKNGLAWLDLVQADMEGLDYACGAVVAPAAGFGAPHIRERLYWVAYADDEGPQRRDGAVLRERAKQRAPGPRSSQGRMVNAESNGRRRGPDDGDEGRRKRTLGQTGAASGMAIPHGGHAIAERVQRGGKHGFVAQDGCDGAELPGPTNGVWRDADWLGCTDGKWRPVEPGTFPLAHGYPQRLGCLRAYGNAICAPQTQAFIEAAMEYAP